MKTKLRPRIWAMITLAFVAVVANAGQWTCKQASGVS